MSLVLIKRTEVFRKRLIGSTASITKNFQLSIPKWAINCKLVKVDKYYEIFADLNDKKDTLFGLVFVLRDGVSADWFKCSSHKNITNFYISGVCRKYGIPSGKYELEEYETIKETGFQLIINKSEK